MTDRSKYMWPGEDMLQPGDTHVSMWQWDDMVAPDGERIQSVLSQHNVRTFTAPIQDLTLGPRKRMVYLTAGRPVSATTVYAAFLRDLGAGAGLIEKEPGVPGPDAAVSLANDLGDGVNNVGRLVDFIQTWGPIVVAGVLTVLIVKELRG